MPPSLLGIFFALTSAAIWGGGDFAGGQASRRHHPFQVLALAALTGLIALLALALVFGELGGSRQLSLADVAWSAAAGICGAIGMASLYRGLSLGDTALVAPTAAVVGATVPVLFAAFTLGLPSQPQLAGFLAGMGGIALLNVGPSLQPGGRVHSLGLAILSGLGFGGFFICIAQAQPGLLFAPLVISKAASLLVALLLLRYRSQQRMPILTPAQNPLAVLAGLLDVGGNVFYLLARQYTRLDVAAVLSSMYPATTVLLASLLLHEPIARPQWFGVALCLLAVALITI